MNDQQARARKGAVRTAWIIAAVAVGIYVVFLVSGVFKA
jgi:hypothetical protein